jgi:hypothetical protein
MNSSANQPGIVAVVCNRFVLLWRERRIRHAKESLAYWSARAETWRQLCAGQHMSYERAYVAEAYANQKKYEARVACLQQSAKLRDAGESGVEQH